MDNEKSRNASQNYYDQSAEVAKTPESRYELNSKLPSRREMISTQGKISSSRQHAALQSEDIFSNSLAFLGAINRSYPAKKSMLKHFKECSLSPCSDEYKFVMEGFKEVEEEPVKSTVAQPKKSKNRKTSFNEFSQGTTKRPSIKITSEFENDKLAYFRPRPRGNTLPARVSEFTTPSEKELDDKTKANTGRLHKFEVAFSPNVKLAWQEINDDLNASTKKETRGNTPKQLQRQDLSTMRRREGKEKRFPENSSRTDGGNVSSRKETRRRKGEIEFPKINGKDFIDDLRMEQNHGKTSDGAHGMADLSRGANWMAHHPQQKRSYSGEHFTEDKSTFRIKQKLSYQFSLPADQCKISEKSFASLNMRNNDVDSVEKLTHKSATISRRSQLSIARANLRRVGNATLVATRLLKIHYRENGINNAAANITQEVKELDELFEEMKDCRYLRHSSTETRF